MILAAEIKTKIRMRKADYIHTYIDSTLMMMKAEEQNFFLQKPLLFSILSFLQLIQKFRIHSMRHEFTEQKKSMLTFQIMRTIEKCIRFLRTFMLL